MSLLRGWDGFFFRFGGVKNSCSGDHDGRQILEADAGISRKKAIARFSRRRFSCLYVLDHALNEVLLFTNLIGTP